MANLCRAGLAVTCAVEAEAMSAFVGGSSTRIASFIPMSRTRAGGVGGALVKIPETIGGSGTSS
jgi:hypothetical protein